MRNSTALIAEGYHIGYKLCHRQEKMFLGITLHAGL